MVDDNNNNNNNKKQKKISRPRKSVAMKSKPPKHDFLENISFRRKIRTGMDRSVHSGSVEEKNGTILKKNDLSEEKNDDLGEFAKAIVRFQREAQLQLNKEYNSYNGRWDDLANQGGGSRSKREHIVMSPDDCAHADVDADVDANMEADTIANVNADANMEADTSANVDADTNMESDTSANVDADTNMESDTNANVDADTNMESDTNANANADANMEADTHANANADANMEADTNANVDAEANETEKQLTEDYLEDDLEAQPESQSGRKRKGRGPTTLPHLTRTNIRIRKVVEYNENGQPIGSVSVELASYMGVLARRMVPIFHQTWRKVPNTLIEKLWSFLERRFVLDPRSKKILISGIGDKWRGFKSSLTRKHVLPFKDQVDLLAHPPKMYGFINQEHWDAFVKSRLSKAFQVVHKAQSDKRGKNLYPHRLSRRGYATLAEDLKNSGEITPNEIDRSLLWKKARQNKKGEYVNDVTREKAIMIDELKNKLKEGTLVNELNDVLTLALGTPEKHGRIRGVGQFVNPTAFFQMPKCGSSKSVGQMDDQMPKCGSSKSVRQMDDQKKLIEGKWQEEIVSRIQVEDQLRATQDRVAQLEEQLAQATNQGITPTLTSKKVCSITTDYPTPANLEPMMQNNGYGKSIDDKMSPPDPKSKHGMELDMSTFHTFYNRASQILTSKLSSIPIVVDEAVFGTDMELFLDLDDIRYMCEMEDLSANCIMVYIRHLHDILVSKGMQDMYTFVNPVFVSSEIGEYISNTITERLQATECQWVFVPFNPERHWILVVINMWTMGCYWLDPLGLPDQYNIKPLVNVGLKALQVDGKRRPNPIWYTVKSPKQSCNSLCGIYVMRYMRELIDELANPLTKKQPFAKVTYNQDEIDAARLEWIHFIEKYI